MIYSPIWKDITFKSNADTLDYVIADESGNTVHNGYTMRMPDQTGITINVNNIVEEYVTPDFDTDIRGAFDDVVKNSEASKNYQIRQLPGTELLETYNFIYDWSYEDRWTGQTRYMMTEPINGHIDSRMRSMFTIYNTGSTTFNYDIEYDLFVNTFPSSLSYDWTGGSRTMSISTNTSWTIISMPDWLSASTLTGSGSYSAVSNTEVVFTATENPAGTGRDGSIVISYGDRTLTIPVTQGYHINLAVSPLSLHYIADGEIKQVSVVTNGNWYIQSKPDWIVAPISSGNGNATVDLVAQGNLRTETRNGVVVFAAGSESVPVTVTQDAFESSITIAPTTYVFSYTGGSQVFTVTSNVSWRLDSYPEWITINGSTSGGAGTFTFTGTTQPNQTFNEKTGRIVVIGSDSSTATAVVSQKNMEKTLTVVPSSLNWTNEGGTKTLTITSNYGWQISGNTSGWFTVSQNSGGSGTTTISVTCGFNPYSTSKTDTLVVYNSDHSIQVPLYQEDNDPSNFWIVCTFDFPQSGNNLVMSTMAQTGRTGTQTLKQTMRVDGVDVPLSKYYNFSEAGEHIVKFQVSGETGSIGWQMWMNNQYLRKVEIAQNVTGAYPNVFSGCTNLTAVTFAQPSMCESLGMDMFANTGIRTFVAPPSLRYISANALQYTESLTSLTLNEGLVHIGNNILSYSAVPELIIPDSVTDVSDFAFTDMHNLTAVTIGRGMTVLGDSLFYRCESLPSITIPANITKLEEGVFCSCDSLMSITALGTTAPTVLQYSFQLIPQGGTLHYPAGADYSSWMSEDRYYLGYFNWSAVGDA